MTRAGVARIATILAILALTLLPAAPASAHAYLISSDPENGSTVTKSPAAVHVAVSEPVTLLDTSDTATVVDAEGDRVDTGAPTLADGGRTIVIPLQPDLPDGVYLVSWGVISADTHPMGGSIQFGVNVPATLVVQADPEPDRFVTLLAGLAKGLVYLGFAVGFGVPIAAAVLRLDAERLRSARRWAVAGLAGAAVGSGAQLFAQYSWVRTALAGTGATDAAGADAAPIGAFLASGYAVAIWVRLALLAVAIVTLLAPRGGGAGGPARIVILAVAGVGAAASVSVNGHGGAGAAWLFISITLHAAAATAWVGGLLVLAALLLRRRLDSAQLRGLGAWSVYAGSAVAVLVVSGIVQSLVQVGFPGALLTTEYGIVLLAKLALVVVALGLAGWGWLWVRRERRNDDGRPAPGRTRQLRRRTRVELGLGAVVIVVSGVLSSLTPAATAYRPVVTADTQIGPYSVEVAVVNARTGAQQIRVRAVPADADDAPPASAVVTASSPQNGLQDVAVEIPYRVTEPVSPDRPAPTRFQSAPVDIPLPGTWRLDITLVIDDWHRYSGSVDYQVEG